MLYAGYSVNKPFAIFWKSAGYIWRISPVGVLVYLGLIVVQGAIPGLLVFYTKSIVDFLIAGAAERSGAMTRFIVWWITLVFLRAAMGSFLMLVQGNLAEKIVERTNVDVMRKAASFTDLRPYEDPAFYDTMNVLWQGSGSRPVNFLLNTSITIRNLVTVTSVLVVLGTIGCCSPIDTRKIIFFSASAVSSSESIASCTARFTSKKVPFGGETSPAASRHQWYTLE